MGPRRDIPSSVALRSSKELAKVPPRAWTGAGDEQQFDGLLKDLSPNGEKGRTLACKARLTSRALHYCARYPPSTANSTPVMYDASSEARNRFAYATSSTRPSRFIGTAAMAAARTSGRASSIGCGTVPTTRCCVRC